MTESVRRASAACLRLLPWVAIGFAVGALLGVMCVLIGWFPEAMATFADNPKLVDPRTLLLGWSGVFGAAVGLSAALMGLGFGVISLGSEGVSGRKSA
ncbi:hypothetical protein [Microbacterium sp. NPDC080005]|uniref:hypothetical protein n=1 Tax=Microbacterium sp. NPDC080005 TaxID=3155288 RepID=UPI00344C921F